MAISWNCWFLRDFWNITSVAYKGVGGKDGGGEGGGWMVGGSQLPKNTGSQAVCSGVYGNSHSGLRP